MRLLRTALVLAMVSTAQPVHSGKPQPPGTSNPEIAFIRISGGSRRFYELRMANEDGTGAATVFSSRDVGQMMVDLGPRADRTFLLVQGGKLSLGTYDNTATGPRMTSLTQIINMNHAGAATAAISRDGDHIVFMKNGLSQLWRHDVATGNQQMLVDLVGYGEGVAVSHDGSTVYYFENEGPELLALKSVPMAGGLVTDHGLRGHYSDVVAANTKGELLITDISDWPVNRILAYNIASGSLTHVENGYAPSYKCDDSRIVYQVINGDSSVSLFYKELPSGAPGTLSTSGNYWPDYIPTC